MRRLFLLLVGLLLFNAQAWSLDDTLPAVKVIAHRGLTAAAPENSMAALQAAWSAGLHGVEIDIRTSADGVPVLLHDSTLDRTTDGIGPVNRNTWPELRNLLLLDRQGQATDERIPGLRQILMWVAKRPDFLVVLDLKAVHPAAIAELVLAYDIAKKVVLFVGGPEKADQIRIFKAISNQLQVSIDLGWWWRIEGLPAFAVSATGADALFAAEWCFPLRGFQEAREAGAKVSVFLWGHKDLPARMLRAVDLGAHVVSSDDPLQLLPLVQPR